MFLFTYAVALPPQVKDHLEPIIREIQQNGFTLGKKVFLFSSRESAVAFAERLADLAGMKFLVEPVSDTPDSHEKYYSLANKYSVAFVGILDETKSGITLDGFMTEPIEEPKDISRKSRIKTTTGGDELLKTEEDWDFAKSSEDVDSSKKTREVMQQTIANLFLAYGNDPRNPGSMEEVEYSVRITLTQLAVSMGFKGESAIVDFLASSQGKTFRDEIEKAALEGKFYIGGSASSEWMSNQWVARRNRGIKHEFYDNALDRCQMALDFLNSWLREAGREELTVPFVPTVHLIVEPTETVRSNLIEAGVQKFSERCTSQEAIASVRKYLVSYYSSERIAENCNKFGNYIYSLAQQGDSEAISTWNKLTSGKNPALTYSVKEDGTIECQINNQSRADNLFSMAVRGKGSLLEAALEQGDSRSASFSLQENITLGINIVEKEKQKFEPGKEGEIRLSVSQTFIDRAGIKRSGIFSGEVVAKVYDEEGSVADCAITKNEDGTYSAKFVPAAGKTYSFIAYAYNSDGKGKMTIDSGRVKQTIKVEEGEKQVWKPYVNAGTSTALVGTYDKIPFTAYKSVEHLKGEQVEATTREGTDVRLAFGVRMSGSDVTKYFECPGEIELRDALVYSIGGLSVIVDRGLKVDEKTSYSKKQLQDMVRQGVVAIKVKAAIGSDIWVTLDGRNVVGEKQSSELQVTGNRLVSLEPTYSKREVLQTSTEDVQNIVISALPGPQANRQRSLIPKAILLPEKPVKFGTETYTAKEIRNLAKEHIIAVVEYKQVGADKVATIYSIDGHEVGPVYSLSKGGVPSDLHGIFLSRPADTKFNFTWRTYVPDIDGIQEVKGYIYSEQRMGTYYQKPEKRFGGETQR